MSAAKKAVDSTLRKILIYTAEIIMSIILLVVICIPLVFGVPIWFQTVVFGAARSELVINPVAWFGAGAIARRRIPTGRKSGVTFYSIFSR